MNCVEVCRGLLRACGAMLRCVECVWWHVERVLSVCSGVLSCVERVLCVLSCVERVLSCVELC